MKITYAFALAIIVIQGAAGASLGATGALGQTAAAKPSSAFAGSGSD